MLITVNGKPATLYGVVDTSKPMLDLLFNTTVKHPATLYFPADSSTVTSPVALAAMPSAVGDRLVVRDASGEVVSSVTADAGGGGQTVFTSAPDLGEGSYTADLVHASGQAGPRHRFTVSGSEPSGARVPVTDPPTSAIATTFIYYPGPDQHLLAEPRPRTSLADAVAGISGEPSGNDASWPFGSLTLASVRQRRRPGRRRLLRRRRRTSGQARRGRRDLLGPEPRPHRVRVRGSPDPGPGHVQGAPLPALRAPRHHRALRLPRRRHP